MYRIIDVEANTIIANSIPTLEAATTLLDLLKLDYPNTTLEIEHYSSNN